jgi:hypothetical protein
MASKTPDPADETDTQREDSTDLSRREFLTGIGGAAATAPVAGEIDQLRLADSPGWSQGGATYGDAQIGPEGYRILAEHEHAQQQRGNEITLSRSVNAVEDIGCDPNGNEPIQDKVSNAAESGMKIVFPPGTYLVTGGLNIGVEGAFGFVGKGFQNASQPPQPGSGSVVFKIQADGPINFLNVNTLQQGKFGNFVIDQRDPLSHGGVQIRSSGNVRVRDIRTVGAQTQVDGKDNNPSFFTPSASGGDSLIVYERCIARGGGVPGSKNIGGCSGFAVFGRNGTRGTVILKDCVIENMADNGIYGARTKAKVRVLGGLYRNNDVSQVRVNGDAIVRGVDVVIDEQNYTGVKSKSNARERGPGWPATNGFKIETRASISSNTGTPIKNCNIVGKSVVSESSVGALVNIWDSGGAVTLDNCRITNNIAGTTSVLAQNPGSGNYAAPPKPWATTLKNSTIQGNQAGKGNPAVDVRERPRSIVTNACLKYPNASSSDIQGAGTSDVSYGQQCQSAGLSNPSKVGSGGNISSLPAPSVSYSESSAVGGASQQYQSKVRNQYRSYVVSVGGALLGFFAFLAALIAGLVSFFSGD